MCLTNGSRLVVDDPTVVSVANQNKKKERREVTFSDKLAMRIKPPEFKGKSYENYRCELKAWSEIT